MSDYEVREISREEGIALADKTARRLLGISIDEFLRRWDSGEITWDDPSTDVNSVAMLLPFVRSIGG